MTDASMNAPEGALLKGPGAAQRTETPLIVQVARGFGVSPVRQLRESWSMRGGRQMLGSNEYYSLRLFDPALSANAKRAFVGQKGVNAINAAMNPPVAVPTRAFVGNKLLYTQLLAQLGLATSETQALVSRSRSAGHLRVLRDAGALAEFLRTDARYPLFGKPHHGSLSEGSVRIAGRDGETLKIANGTTRDIDSFAAEVFGRYAGGFLLQSALDPHAEMARVAGGAIGCVRVVTANDGDGPAPVYAVWKLPAPTAMSDNFWQAGSLLAAIELRTGKVTRVARGTGLKAEVLSDHPTSGARLVDMQLPCWSETLDLAVAAHRVFPEFGVCGFDVAVTDNGPVILECNDNPSHMLYQVANGRGLLSADLVSMWDRVAERQKHQVARIKAATEKSR